MLEGVYFGFDFGLKRIGLAVGQKLTGSASPLTTLDAKQGVPDWNILENLVKKWNPKAFVVGLPTRLNGEDLYITSLTKGFAKKLEAKFSLPVFMEDERLSTIEARSEMFAQGGYQKLERTNLDSIAACIILEQWLNSRIRST